ncbi:2OG-Fe(II) oxygenase [Sulfitobacter sp. D35]|uniref:2OG-Fe(II) oxygenase n=1 Tax=Sulfitobacter sp. D35 TaxID=3083252 RepID=UPI00296E4192|nr:2OG-Fe(II) oxygenase [Sulfitobacter sp. D35]MDW4496662.1 2OG-Fe(II) oxygenase [Sulfitobacter sp. D35]
MREPFLSIETHRADATDAPGDALDRLRRGDLGAIVLRDVFDPDCLARLPAELAINTPGFVRTEFPPAFHAYFYGINLNLADPDLTPYFAAEPAFRRSLAGLDVGGVPAEQRICDLLSRLDRDRPYAPAPGPAPGQRHFFTTIRAHRTGGYIPAHFDNEAAARPTYRHVAALCEPGIYSFVLCIDPAEAGGALEVFNVTSREAAQAFRNRDHAGHKRDLASVEKVAIRLEAGEMVLLHSSRYLHGVSPVEGTRTRWTMCSFMALSRNSLRGYCWG